MKPAAQELQSTGVSNSLEITVVELLLVQLSVGFLEFEFGAATSEITLKRRIGTTSTRLEEATLAKGWLAKGSLCFGSPSWSCGGET